MAIIDNRVTEEGDVLIIKPEVPIIGIISLFNFVDTTQGESLEDYFKKEFRFSSTGGLTFSDWEELTLININNLLITKYDQFVIEYRYTRVGDAPEVELEFDDILVSGEFEDLPYPIYNTTYFKDFFEVNNINVFGWALNVLEKLYLKGILPEYMIRGENLNNNLEDQDFIVFWNSVTHYFAILVYYMRQYRDITQVPALLEDFVMNRGLELGNISVEDTIYLFNNYVEQYRLRGTNSIIEKKVDGTDIDGEFMRLINYQQGDEFIFALLQNFEMGWCIGKSSPTWKGTENMINLIKGYEFTKEIVDLSKYPLVNPEYISIDGDDMLISSVPATITSGIYQDVDDSKRIPVDPSIDYEISFFAEISDVGVPITASIKGYDIAGNNINFDSVKTGLTRNNFFSRQTLKLSDRRYWIRLTLYNENKSIDSNDYVFPGGENLKFKEDSSIKYIIPNILLDNSTGVATSGDLKLYNIKVRPRLTPFSRGLLGVNNIILAYLVNRNAQYDIDALESIIENSLIPANSFFKAKYL